MPVIQISDQYHNKRKLPLCYIFKIQGITFWYIFSSQAVTSCVSLNLALIILHWVHALLAVLIPHTNSCVRHDPHMNEQMNAYLKKQTPATIRNTMPNATNRLIRAGGGRKHK